MLRLRTKTFVDWLLTLEPATRSVASLWKTMSEPLLLRAAAACPAGTLTPLHCDDQDILFAQTSGSKHVRLVPPHFLDRVYNQDTCYSSVTLESIDLARFPAMRGVPVLETVLEPGECLFIPLGWWHWVKSLEISTSLTFTNFVGSEPQLVWRELMS